MVLRKGTRGGQAAAAGAAASAGPPLLATPPPPVAALFPADETTVFTDGGALPRLVVFDLDYTLWPFWVDTHVSAPVRSVDGRSPTIAVLDKFGERFAFYGDVPAILQALPAAGISMGVASRTSAPDLARDVLRLLQVPAVDTTTANSNDTTTITTNTTPHRRALDVFAGGLEIYPTNKLRHMEALQRRTGFAYEDFLFFDDESRNRNVETLGVTMCLVRDGVSWREMERGVRQWRARRGYTAGSPPPVVADDDDDDDD